MQAKRLEVDGCNKHWTYIQELDPLHVVLISLICKQDDQFRMNAIFQQHLIYLDR